MKLRVKYLRSNGERMRGLMFSETFEPVYFQTRFGIHTFFVRFPIDVLIMDDEFRVVKIKSNLKSWRIYIWNPKYQNVLETKGGFVNRYKIKINQKLDLEFI